VSARWRRGARRRTFGLQDEPERGRDTSERLRGQHHRRRRLRWPVHAAPAAASASPRASSSRRRGTAAPGGGTATRARAATSRACSNSYAFGDSIQQEWHWSERFAAQEEIPRYANWIADRFDLCRDMRFETRVTHAAWDEAAGSWHVETNRGDRVACRHLVMVTAAPPGRRRRRRVAPARPDAYTAGPSRPGEVPERSIGSVSKTDVLLVGTVGSNPTLSANVFSRLSGVETTAAFTPASPLTGL
jgi:hypothetical protein